MKALPEVAGWPATGVVPVDGLQEGVGAGAPIICLLVGDGPELLGWLGLWLVVCRLVRPGAAWRRRGRLVLTWLLIWLGWLPGAADGLWLRLLSPSLRCGSGGQDGEREECELHIDESNGIYISRNSPKLKASLETYSLSLKVYCNWIAVKMDCDGAGSPPYISNY